ncbi:hypothetical protein NIES4072_18560 [Nostoc commune NIES-4072]|uniref:Uncharacterized protein n=1 Tax=Nostoc commune NIES-4072 TaxID=2005467 RepID=A0A2R5FHP6_NOSCO|nr:hypothetical protein [Nostoc commune]BBD64482.1 hypothetical protein NIES4070_08250 [Nostoc commune HK-02]GBG18192.1 hypothetical protein NIES4072_18560 [Nostoc commune NIES-4072]
MLTSNMVLPDYVCLADVVKNHPEPKLLINDNQAVDREIQRLLDNLTSAFSLGISLFNSH